MKACVEEQMQAVCTDDAGMRHPCGRRPQAQSGGKDADWAAHALQLRLYITACL